MSEPVAQEALDRAFADRDLLLVYQPIHEATTRRIYSAEALLRQRRESGEIREASIITETAEQGPELFALDDFTMTRAHRDAAFWQTHGSPDVRLNVNLSPREFQEGNVIARLTALLAGCAVNTRRINLEITETTYIDKPRETMDILGELKKLGISIWLDDFGTKFSSLTHLQHFPIDGLKIPGGFVKGLADSSRCRAIARSLIELAHEIGIKVVAEEIETEEQLKFLLDWNCDYIQGFLWSRPMPLDQFMAFLAET